ncbi:MAG: UDP-N-acetylmuramate dehydrogenase [Ignavibacteria bacterium]|nr:UDP-N-acetylmuramate dehydrogenase [Ignavibacteria bacterium]
MIKILENVSLKEKNTFAVESIAKYYTEILNENQLLSLLETNAFQSSRKYFLGGGSNTLFLGDFDGIVIHLVNKGIKFIENNKYFAILDVEAGVGWHNFVEITLRNKLFGLENLALIPGTVGGAITQNIGAYGAELKDFIVDVRGVDIRSGRFITFQANDCKFGYRTSIFKSDLKGKFIITSSKLKLQKKPNVNLSYPELRKIVKKFPFIKPDPKYIFEQVVKLRQSKLPDLIKYPNAGSFFKNPIVNEGIYSRLKKEFPDVPAFEVTNGLYKIPAGWLIEKAGWKGKRIGNVGTYEKHSLVIINYGVKTGLEVLDFAKLIQKDVYEKFGISLENEVEIVN